MIQLNEEQQIAREDLLDASDNDTVMTLVGPAGTGKTTLVRQVAEDFRTLKGREVILGAPTGKAAYNLRRKANLPARTLHSILYGSVVRRTKYDQRVDWDMLSEADPSHIAMIEVAQGQGVRYLEQFSENLPYFDTRELQYVAEPDDPFHPFWSPTSDEAPRTELEFGGPRHEIQPNHVVIVDEASMVGTTLHEEIMEQMPQGARLLYVGDKEQLPPVKQDWGPNFYYPTAELTEIHRQAAGNPIIQIATGIRNGGTFPLKNMGNGAFTRRRATTQSIVDWAADHYRRHRDFMVLCYTNRVRIAINSGVRHLLGFQGPVVVGDRLKVAKNNKTHGRMNGEVVWVTDVVQPAGEESNRGELIVTVTDDEGRFTTALCQPNMVGESQDDWFQYCRENRIYKERQERYLHFDYGYCLTVHAAQGSEFEDVGFVMDGSISALRQRAPEDARRLIYTAATRAAERLTVFDHAGR